MTPTDPVFWQLARYFVNHNYFRQPEVPVIQGKENNNSRGLLLVADGPSLEKLVENHVREDVDFTSLPHEEVTDLIDEDHNHGSEDGAYLLRTDEESAKLSTLVTMYGVVEQLGGNIQDALGHLVPDDFLRTTGLRKCRGRTVPITSDIGTKTKIALALPQLYNDVRTYVIKTSMYGNMHTGKLVCFTGDGLIAEAFLRREDNLPQEFYIDKNVAMVLRQYELKDDKVQLVSEEYVPANKILETLPVAQTG
jgi:hypothetical protein